MAKKSKGLNNLAVPRKRLSVALLSRAIPEHRGNFSSIARACGVTRVAVWDYVQRHPELQPLLKDAREARLDNGEHSLDRAVDAGEAWAVTLLLKTQGRDRGYVEKTEVDVNNVTRLVVEEVVVDGDTPQDGPAPPGSG